MEVLLGNMTETLIELVDILEDLNTAKIKNENDFIKEVAEINLQNVELI